jgi:CheY-like chemotaxis protein
MNPPAFSLDELIDLVEGPAPAMKERLPQWFQAEPRQFVEGIQECLFRLNGPLLFRLLEWVVDLGQEAEPFIGSFLARILRERSSLQAKSLLLLYGYLDSYQALVRLEQARPRLRWELHAVYKKTLLQLQDHFAGSHHLQEFLKHGSDPEKMQELAKQLLIKPSPELPRAMNRLIQSQHGRGLVVVAGVVDELGHSSSLGVVEARLEEMLLGLPIWLQWVRFGLGKDKKWPIVDAEFNQAGIARQFISFMKQGLKAEALQFLWEQYRWPPDLWLPLRPVLEPVFRGSTAPQEAAERLTQAVYSVTRVPPQEVLQLAHALGSLAMNHGRGAMVSKFERMLGGTHPWEHPVLVAMLGGYQSDEGRAQLVSWLEKEQDPEALYQLLQALSRYHFRHVPAGLLHLLEGQRDERELPLLIGIVAGSSDRDRLLPYLHGQSEAFKLELLRQLPLHPFSATGTHLHQLLDHPSSSTALRSATLRALREMRHGDAWARACSLLEKEQAEGLRLEALKTIMQRGPRPCAGDLLYRFRQMPARENLQLTLQMLQELKEDISPMMGAKVGLQLEAWRELLADDRQEVRMRSLQVLQLQDPMEYEAPNQWGQWLRAWVDDEQRRITPEERTMVLRIISDLKAVGSPGLPNSMAEFLEEFSHLNHYHRGRWMQMLAQNASNFCDSMDQETQSSFSSEMLAFFEEFQHDAAMMKSLLTVILQSGLPVFRPIIEELTRHGDGDLARTAQAALEKKVTPSLNLRNILLVDDSRMISQSLTRFLEKMGFQTEAWHDGQGQMQPDKRPDLLILDFFVGEERGTTIYQRFLNCWPDPIPTIFITSSRGEEPIEEIRQVCPGAPLLHKPFPLSKLLECIEGLRTPSASGPP